MGTYDQYITMIKYLKLNYYLLRDIIFGYLILRYK